MIQNIKINLSKNNKNINYKSYFYSGLLSIILIAFILTIFEILFFYFIAKPEIINSLDGLTNKISDTIKESLNTPVNKSKCEVFKYFAFCRLCE